MVKQHQIFVLLILLLLLIWSGSNVLADSDDEFEEDEILEEVGELFGWGIVVFGVAAGLLFPLRRYSKTLLQRFPSIRDWFRKVLRNLAKLHPFIGLIALSLALVHGIIMFIDEGELGFREWIGVAAFILLAIAGVYGWNLLKKKKKNVREQRKTHIMFIVAVIILATIHIALS